MPLKKMAKIVIPCIYNLQLYMYLYVVVNFLYQVIFVFLLFLGVVMYANEVETKEKYKFPEIKINYNITLYCITQGIQQTLEFEKSTHVDSNFFKSSFGLQIIVLILNSMTTNDIDRLILNHAVWGKACVMASASDVSLYSRSPF